MRLDPARPDEALGISRRRFLRGAGLSAGAVVLGSGLAAGLAACGGDDESSAPEATPTSAEPQPLGSYAEQTLKFVWVGASCEAPLYVAYEKGFFEEEGLDVELVKTDGTAVHDVVATNKAQGAPGILFQWLKPIEQGVNVKLTGGLHGGCLRLIAGEDSGIASIEDVKGKTIATDAIGGSAQAFFSVILGKAGIDPVRDVQWKAYPFDQLGEVVKRGEVPASAAPDPFVFMAIREGYATQIASNLDPGYENHFCCVVALNGDLVRDDIGTSQAIVRAWFRGAAFAGANPEEVAQLEVEKNYVPIDTPVIVELLEEYPFTPSSAQLVEELPNSVAEFKTTGILEDSTDPEELAQQAYVDLFGGQEPAIKAAYFGTSLNGLGRGHGA